MTEKREMRSMGEGHVTKIEDLKTDQEIANFLLTKYPEHIKEIKINDPEKVMVNGVPLPKFISELKENIENHIQDPALIFFVDAIAKYKAGPLMIDTFGNNREERNLWIEKITNNKTNPLEQFFVRNKFKHRNPSGMTQTIFVENYISQELKQEMENLATKIGLKAYAEMPIAEKAEIVAQVDALTTKVLLELDSKYSQ
ncbi:hypothetical protein IT400_01320 [Candidatus Nomurabacteria bacterium]|nr:hypothetical protein [Candidatus Nomurabacteria bacterium]